MGCLRLGDLFTALVAGYGYALVGSRLAGF